MHHLFLPRANRTSKLLLVLLAAVWSVQAQAPASGASSELKPVLKAIDPSQAKLDPSVTGSAPPATNPARKRDANAAAAGQEAEASPSSGAPMPDSSLIPQFGKPLPAVPAGPGPAVSPNSWSTQPGAWSPSSPGPGTDPALAALEPRVARLEQTAFGATYPEHEVEDRIDHLEREILGKKTGDGNYEQRLAGVEKKIGVQSAFGGSPPPPSASRPPTTGAPIGRDWVAGSASNNNYGRQVEKPAAVAYAPPGAGYPAPIAVFPTQSQAPPSSGYPTSASAYTPPPAAYPSAGTGYPPATQPGAPRSVTYAPAGTGYPAPVPVMPAQSQAPPASGSPTSAGAYTPPPAAYPSAGASYPPALQPSSQPAAIAQQSPAASYPPTGSVTPPQAAYTSNPGGYQRQPSSYSPATGYPPGEGHAQPGAYPPQRGAYPPPPGGYQPQGLATGAAPFLPGAAGTQNQQSSGFRPGVGPSPTAPQPPAPATKPPAAIGSSVKPPPSPSVTTPTAASGTEHPNPTRDMASLVDTSNFAAVVAAMLCDRDKGDYFSQIQRFSGSNCARWTSFPITVHLPQGSPPAWHQSLEMAVKRWGAYIPVKIVSPNENADIEVAWTNHLPPRHLGVTNLEIFNGRMRVTVYLLRPSYYLKPIPEKTLQLVALHQMGHALGIFGHSSTAGDIMQPINVSTSPKPAMTTKYAGISVRDVNTLKKIYESPGLPAGFQSPQPAVFP